MALYPQYFKLESTDGQTVKVYFNPSSSKSSYQDLPEDERQKIKDLLFILGKFNVSESTYRELTVFCDGLPRKYLVSQCRENINSLYNFERIPGNIPGAYVSLESEIFRYIKYHVNPETEKKKLNVRGTGQKLVELQTLSCCPFL